VIRQQTRDHEAPRWFLARPATSVTRVVKNNRLRHAGRFLVDGVTDVGHHLDHISVLRSYDADVVISRESNAVHQTVGASETQPRLTAHQHQHNVLVQGSHSLAYKIFQDTHNIVPRLFYSPTMFKDIDKQQLLTLYTQCNSTTQCKTFIKETFPLTT